MKALAINGSHRKGKNTAILLKAVLSELEKGGIETELIELSDFRIESCRACNKCLFKPECSIKDDDMATIAQKMIEADVIIMGSPVYNGNVTSKLKTLLDRTRWMHMTKEMLAGKLGAVVTVAGLRNGGQELANEILERFLASRQIEVVHPRDPDGNIFNLGVMGTLFDEITENDGKLTVRWKKSVQDDKLAMAMCKILADRIIHELRKRHGSACLSC